MSDQHGNPGGPDQPVPGVPPTPPPPPPGQPPPAGPGYLPPPFGNPSQQPPAGPGYPPPPPGNPSQQKLVIGLAIALGVVLLLLCGGGAGVYVLSQRDEPSPTVSAPTSPEPRQPSTEPSPTEDSTGPSSAAALVEDACGPARTIARQQGLELLGAPTPSVRTNSGRSGALIEVVCRLDANGISSTVTLTLASGAEDLARTYDLAKQTAWTYPSAKERTRVSGVGDEAWASTRGTDASGGIGYTVIGRTDHSVVVVNGNSGEEFGAAKNKELLIALAKAYIATGDR